MARIISGFEFTGKLGNISAYRLKDSGIIVMRTTGGASRKKVLKDPAYARTRENASEFGRCAKAAKGIRKSIEAVRHLADYNFTSDLISLCKKIQLMDSVNVRGEREVDLPAHAHFFSGFQLNHKYPFDSIVRSSVSYGIDRNTKTATIEIPSLLPGVNLQLPWPVPKYRIIVSLGLAPVEYLQSVWDGRPELRNVSTNTEWLPSNQPFVGQAFSLQHNSSDIDGCAITLAIGIEMEIPQLKGWGGVRKIGAAKILEMK